MVREGRHRSVALERGVPGMVYFWTMLDANGLLIPRNRYRVLDGTEFLLLWNALRALMKSLKRRRDCSFVDNFDI